MNGLIVFVLAMSCAVAVLIYEVGQPRATLTTWVLLAVCLLAVMAGGFVLRIRAK